LNDQNYHLLRTFQLKFHTHLHLYFAIPNPTAAVFFRLAEILCVDLNYFSESFQSEDDEPAFKMTIDNIGDNEQTV